MVCLSILVYDHDVAHEMWSAWNVFLMFSTSVCLASEHTTALPCLPYSDHDAGMLHVCYTGNTTGIYSALHVPDPRGRHHV